MSTTDANHRPSARPRRRLILGAIFGGLVVITATTVVGLLQLTGAPRTSTPGVGGRIVVVDASGLVRTMDATGDAERRYALAGGPLQFPAWSPGGGRLAVVGVPDEGPGLFVLDDGPGAPSPEVIPSPIYQSAAEPPFYLYWSPDGRQVTFLTSEAGGLALRSAPADGSAPGAIVRRGAPMYWAWTADDRLLVHAGGDGPDAYLGEVGLDGSEARRAAVVPGLFQAPAASSDGIRRAYVVSTDDPEPEDRSTVILVEDSRDGSVRRIAVRGPTALGWDPGGDRLAYIAPHERTALPVGSLDLLDPASTQPRTLLDDDVVAFFWAPDGASIAALALTADQPRQVASRGAVPPDLDAPPPLIEGQPGGALQLVVLAADDGAIRLERPVRVSATFVGQLLPYFDQYALSHRLWSPDGSALVLPLVDGDGLTHITIVPVDDGEPRVIADGEIAFWEP